MITKKELSYVSAWAKKVPYPGMDYAEQAAELLVNSYDDFKKFYLNKQYDIILSNGEQILFEILSMNLSHMLGIDYKNLSSDYMLSFREEVLNISGNARSFDLLEAIIKNINDVLKYDYDNNGKILNYYRIMIKCSIFDKLSDFNRFNFGIINFDKNIYTEKNNVIFNGNSEKLLYVQSNEPTAPYFMMGILKNTDINSGEVEEKYAVETLMAPFNVSDFFNCQEVVIPTQILVTTEDKMNKRIATSSEKLALLNQYRSIINQYGLPNMLNIYGDYEVMLNSNSNPKTRIK